MRGGAAVARVAHTHEDEGSIPSPATNSVGSPDDTVVAA